MERLIFTLFFVVLSSLLADSLKCYKCMENKISYADCDAKRKEIACDASKGEDRCVKGDVSYTLHSQDVKKFKKGCVKSIECSKKVNTLCKTTSLVSSKTCKIHCCSTDLCNAGSHLVVSVVVAVSCVLVFLILL